ncbi:hypothetical protein Q0F99_12970 [Rathayibacter oskolensis]|nr:hypothetical protein [Rathayibacter oskolensis]WKK70704.1 hypothetical protein Q0F99_12970 [Rathayibacter oskolensis]
MRKLSSSATIELTMMLTISSFAPRNTRKTAGTRPTSAPATAAAASAAIGCRPPGSCTW